MPATKREAALPRKLKGSVGAIHQLPYYSKSLETSRARHVTVEQIWGQMNMLLRPVLRRLQDNVRRVQKNVKGSSAAQQRGTKKEQKKRPRDEDNDDDSDAVEDAKDVLSTKTSELSESDLDEEIAELLAEQQRRKKLTKSVNKNDLNGDESWRYAFGKGGDEDDDDDGDADVDGEKEDAEDDDDDDNEDDARIRRRHARAMQEADDEEDDDEDRRGDEELAALKEMYGDDFDPDEEGEDFDGDEEGDEEDPHFEEDLAWDDPTAVFNENDGRYFGNDDILADDGEPSQQPGENDDEAYDEEEDDAELDDPNLTALQRERLRERRLVERLEQERLYSTQWAMSGEASGKDRPRDALLDEELDFEHAMKAVPVITEAVTAKLEDRIRRRILDANYDDVERRTSLSAPADLVTTRRDTTLDSEKSKLSLMDLYEKEYLERARAAEDANGEAAQTAEPLTEIEKDELRAIQMWRRLAQHLDALSNFYYTPKPVQEDLAARVRAVDGQAPAITLETVGNFATTRETALAPQDLYRGADRKYADVGSNELAPRERRALRRAKKDQAKAVSDRKEKRAVQAKKKKPVPPSS